MATRKSSLPDILDIRRAAYSMIDNHGRQAAQVAMNRARNLGEDARDAKILWERIVTTISEMQNGQSSVYS